MSIWFKTRSELQFPEFSPLGVVILRTLACTAGFLLVYMGVRLTRARPWVIAAGVLLIGVGLFWSPTG